MRSAGAILAGILERLCAAVASGMTTADIDALAEDFIRRAKVEPAFLGYRGYPARVCTSVNEEVVHGIPGARRLKDGDIVSLDLGIQYQGFFSDIASTVAVGAVSAEARKLIDTTRNSLYDGIRQACAGNRLTDISSAVQQTVEKEGFSVVRQFVGHGIGTQLHEEPEVPNFGSPSQGPLLKAGMVLAIEPMVNAGTWECRILRDGWTAVTADGRLSAHFEHTVAVTDDGPQILTEP